MSIESSLVLVLTVLAGGVSAIGGTFLGLALCEYLRKQTTQGRHYERPGGYV